MTDRLRPDADASGRALGEALAWYDTLETPIHVGHPADDAIVVFVAAARNWHTLTNGGTLDRLAGLLHRRWYCHNPQPCGTCKADASAVVDALSDTAESE